MAAHQGNIGEPTSAKINRWIKNLNKWTEVTNMNLYGLGRKVFGRKSNEVAPIMTIRITLEEWNNMRFTDIDNANDEVIPGINNCMPRELVKLEDPNPHFGKGLRRILKETSVEVALRLPFLNIAVTNVFDCAKLAKIPREDILEADIAQKRIVWPGRDILDAYLINKNNLLEMFHNAEPGIVGDNHEEMAERQALEELRNGIRDYLSREYINANPSRVLIATEEHHGRAELRVYEWNNSGHLCYYDLITNISMSHMVSADDPCKIILLINKQNNKKDTKPAEDVFTDDKRGGDIRRTSQLIVCNSGDNGLDDIIRVQLITETEHAALTNGDQGFVIEPCWFKALFANTVLPITWARTRSLYNEWLFCSRPAIYQLLTTSVREMRNVKINVREMSPPVRVTVNGVDDICYGFGRLTLRGGTLPGSRNQTVSILRYNSENPNNMKKYLWRI